MRFIPTRPCSHDFMTQPSLYMMSWEDIIHDVDGCNRHSGAKLNQVEPSWGQVGAKLKPSWAKLSQVRAKLEPSWSQVEPSWAKLSQVEAKLRRSWSQVEPCSAKLKPSRRQVEPSWGKLEPRGNALAMKIRCFLRIRTALRREHHFIKNRLAIKIKKCRKYSTGYQICKIKIRCFLRMCTALRREHHFIKNSPSGTTDLRRRLLK